jgi:hypothetical protein
MNQPASPGAQRHQCDVCCEVAVAVIDAAIGYHEKVALRHSGAVHTAPIKSKAGRR